MLKFGEDPLNVAGANDESRFLKLGLVMSVACTKANAKKIPEILSQMVAIDVRMVQIIPRFTGPQLIVLKKGDADDKDADDGKEERVPVEGMDQPEFQVCFDLWFFDMRKTDTGL